MCMCLYVRVPLYAIWIHICIHAYVWINIMQIYTCVYVCIYITLASTLILLDRFRQGISNCDQTEHGTSIYSSGKLYRLLYLLPFILKLAALLKSMLSFFTMNDPKVISLLQWPKCAFLFNRKFSDYYYCVLLSINIWSIIHSVFNCCHNF